MAFFSSSSMIFKFIFVSLGCFVLGKFSHAHCPNPQFFDILCEKVEKA